MSRIGIHQSWRWSWYQKWHIYISPSRIPSITYCWCLRYPAKPPPGMYQKNGISTTNLNWFSPHISATSTHKIEPVNPSKKGRDQLGSRYIYIWVVPPEHPKMIIFSRKTHGCWVPPFWETPIYSMHIAAWHLLQHAQVKLRSIRFEEQHVALPGCRKQSGIPLQNSKWLNVSNGQSQIDLIWYSICNISLYIFIISTFVFISCLYIYICV